MPCSNEENWLVLIVNTVYNLCNLWVTDTSYCNQRLRTNTRNHSMFWSPLFFDFTKDILTFSQFALEIKLHKIIIHATKVSVDLEKAITPMCQVLTAKEWKENWKIALQKPFQCFCKK